MGKRVILTLMPGSFEQGFGVILRIKEDGEPAETGVQVVGQLPPAPNILQVFKQWQSAYRQIVMPHSRIKSKPGQVTNFSCHQLSSQLAECLNEWLNSGSSSWQKLRDRLQQNLSETEEILVIIETDDLRLRQLPWHLWDLFSEHYTKAEIALSTSEYQPLVGTTTTLTDKVRILAILGNSTGIDVEQDRSILKQLPHAEITFLVEPKRQQLNNQFWEQQWDILFFAGHSSSQVDGDTGQIYINQTDSLSIAELKNALRRAISGGLQIAIFNSCDGLGLARELAELYIPQIVVMREPVPDKVAQEFLQHFLTSFASGKSLYLAVRASRERLQGLEDKFPCASWLPVIFQNPAFVPPTWPELRDKIDSTSPTPPRLAKLGVVLLANVVITILLMGVRWSGMFQTWELMAFDHLMQRLPIESADNRLLIVNVDEGDINKYNYPLPDDILAQLLNKLQQYQPSVIGLDIFRTHPVPGDNHVGHQALVAHIQQNEDLIAICAFGKNFQDSIGHLPQIRDDTIPKQLGFADLPNDGQLTNDQDYTVRRYILSRGSKDPQSKLSRCTTPYSFALQLAYRYLKAKGIPVETEEDNWKFGEIVAKRLETRSGGYQNLDAQGNQLLINYRNTPQIAQQLTVRDVLEDRYNFHPTLVKDRAVLIGVTAASVQDPHNTPLGRMRGLYVHAHVVSQILSAVEDDNHRFLRWWPQWGDFLWVLFWSFTGGIIVWRLRIPLHRGLAVSISIIVLYGLCWGFFTQGRWIPLVPSALAVVFTGGSVVAYTAFLNSKHN